VLKQDLLAELGSSTMSRLDAIGAAAQSFRALTELERARGVVGFRSESLA
jgi:hypothetical protein